ncbi:hypothetical protein AKJ09_05846 [Labilithrix luteola]|uniref:Uncharacterized protein n=1 Tax=Labilithrix luteola TaxID=1391654 RepID=A0A0K1Q0A7_9BACT|nr:hypothetical protein AKJ09_05846 [Labilithrix luteola]
MVLRLDRALVTQHAAVSEKTGVFRVFRVFAMARLLYARSARWRSSTR